MARVAGGDERGYRDPPVLEARLLERGLVVDRHGVTRAAQQGEEKGGGGIQEPAVGGWVDSRRRGGVASL